jgi:primosomal protein N'
MIFPQPMENVVMQVNMGEGKSSVIIPICATDLADGHQLVRVIVPKALQVQTLQHLANRLGGLVDRSIYHVSFSRGDSNVSVDQLRKIVSRCTDGRGVIVMQPEHLLSLKLTSVEKQLLKDNIVANSSQMEQKSLSQRVLADWWRKPVSTVTIMMMMILSRLTIGETADGKHPCRCCVSAGKGLASRVSCKFD